MSCIALFISLAMRVALGSLPGASQQEAQAGREGGYIRDELKIRKLPQTWRASPDRSKSTRCYSINAVFVQCCGLNQRQNKCHTGFTDAALH